MAESRRRRRRPRKQSPRQKSAYMLELQIDESFTNFALADRNAPVSFEEVYAEKSKEAALQENEELCYVGNGVFAVFAVERRNAKIEKFNELRRLDALEKPHESAEWQKKLLIPVFPEHVLHAEPLYELYRNKNITQYFS